MSSKTEKEIEAVFILEILGKPKEHLISSLKEIIEKISQEKGVKILNEKIHEPKEHKDKQDFFTTYAEIEIKAEELSVLARLMFKYMPSHIDILYPENLVLTNNSFAEVLNEITRRLHGYEEIARVLQFEKQMLEKKLKELSEK